MKRKNIISIILMLVLAVTMCATLVACNNNGTNNSKYTVTFTNGDTVVKTLTELPAGTQLTAEQIPTIDSLPEDKEFKGWFVGVGEDGVEVKAGYTVNGDVRVVAKIVDKSSGDSNIVTVTFKSEGEVISTQPVNKGDTALEPKDPERGAQWRFDGWYFGATEFDFNTPITADITLVAKWTEVVPTSITGSGTKTDPYVLWTANDIINFSSRVNDPATAGNEGYYDAYYRLGKDIDMTGVSNYAPAGKVTTYENANGDEIEVNGFEGVFDGDGHKISNLTMNRSLR
ncbi:MAG: InlB B-repeat-containing protein, partial [Clostridia bacterium]|nr:InlB B-repeat-containing protein [Clostridia bacterium]